MRSERRESHGVTRRGGIASLSVETDNRVQCGVTVVSELQLLQPHSRQGAERSARHHVRTGSMTGLCLASGPWSTLLNPFGPTLVISTSSSFSISIMPWTSVSPTTSPPLLVIQRVSGSIQPHPVLSCPIVSQGSTNAMYLGGNHLEFDMNPGRTTYRAVCSCRP
jgi:hypothetical protein